MKGNPQYGLFVPDNAERTKEIIEKFSFFISKTILLNILAYFQCGQKFVSKTKCDFKIKAFSKGKTKNGISIQLKVKKIFIKILKIMLRLMRRKK